MAFGTLIHRHPARGLVRRDFDRLMDDLWGGFGLAPLVLGAPGTIARSGPPNGRGEAEARYTPRLDAVELEDGYRVTAELPGVDAKVFERKGFTQVRKGSIVYEIDGQEKTWPLTVLMRVREGRWKALMMIDPRKR